MSISNEDDDEKDENDIQRDPIYEEQDEIVLPVQNRKIRDLIFFVLFVAFIISLIGFIIHTGSKGDLDRLAHGADKHGNVCGKRNFEIPGARFSGQDKRNEPFAEIVGSGGAVYLNCTSRCPEDTTSLLYRCVPKRVAQLASSVGEVVTVVTSSDFLQESAQDIETCWLEMIYLCLIALVLSVATVFLLRYVAGIIIWVSVGLVIVGSVSGTIYLWYCWSEAKKKVDEFNDKYSEEYQPSVRKWLIFAILATVFTVVLMLIVLVMRNRIRLVVALFEEAGKAIGAMPSILLQPVYTFLGLLVICGAWVIALLFIECAGTPTVFPNEIVEFKKDTTMNFTLWYHVFALLWTTQFCLACQDVVIAGAVSIWYFTRDKSQLQSPISTSVHRLFRYHVGSVAMGSLIIALVKAIRILFKYLEKKLAHYSNSSVARCIVCIIQCGLYCFENFLKYLSRNAYIEIAIFGVSFCEGAKRAFRIITNNALRVAAINSVGDFTLLLSKIGIVLAVVFIGIELIKGKPGVQHMWVPITLCALFGLLISHCFFTVYEMTIDTLLVCFCEDCDMNDGISQPYFMNASLMKFVKNSKKELAMLAANGQKIQPMQPRQKSFYE